MSGTLSVLSNGLRGLLNEKECVYDGTKGWISQIKNDLEMKCVPRERSITVLSQDDLN